MCVCVRERENVCVCVRERERERENLLVVEMKNIGKYNTGTRARTLLRELPFSTSILIVISWVFFPILTIK